MTELNRREFGRTGLMVSELGFGGAGVGHAYGASDDETCARAVARAVELGVNFFDTSPVYGAGTSEQNIGKGLAMASASGLTGSLASVRDQVVIASKVRLADEADLADMSGAIARSVDESLERLGTDRIDILQIHHQVARERGRYLAVASPPRYALSLTARDCMAFAEAAQPLIDDGTIGWLGITAWDGDRNSVAELLASGAFASAQVLYNLVNHSAATPVPQGFDDIDQGEALVTAQNHGVAVIGIRSHAAGALADVVDRDVAPDSDVARDHARACALKALLTGELATLSALALRFCLDHPAIATVTPGFKNAAEVEEAVQVSRLARLEADAMAEIDRLYRRQFRP